MKKVFLIALIVLAASSSCADESKINTDKYLFAKSQPKFKCDGRQYCSQMRSCAEAKFFINNCQNTKMDGDGDGVPCEKQWCGRH